MLDTQQPGKTRAKRHSSRSALGDRSDDDLPSRRTRKPSTPENFGLRISHHNMEVPEAAFGQAEGNHHSAAASAVKCFTSRCAWAGSALRLRTQIVSRRGAHA